MEDIKTVPSETEATLALSKLPQLRAKVRALRAELHEAERELIEASEAVEVMDAVDELTLFLAKSDSEHFELYLHLSNS